MNWLYQLRRYTGHIAVICTLFILISACAMRPIYVPETHPGEVDLTRYKRIAIGKIEGNAGDDIGGILKDRISRLDSLELIDRFHFDQILGELKFSQDELSDEARRHKLGQLLPATVLILGNASSEYSEATESQSTACPSPAGYIPCTAVRRVGSAYVKGTLQVQEVETGRVVLAKRLQEKAGSTTQWLFNSFEPPALDRAAIQQSALDNASQLFAKAILPWSEKVKVNFFVDSDIPQLTVGIRQAESGDWKDAISSFKEALSKVDSQKETSPKILAGIHWNLMLACLYSWDLDEAQKHIKTIERLAPDDYSTSEFKNTLERKRKERSRVGKS